MENQNKRRSRIERHDCAIPHEECRHNWPDLAPTCWPRPTRSVTVRRWLPAWWQRDIVITPITTPISTQTTTEQLFGTAAAAATTATTTTSSTTTKKIDKDDDGGALELETLETTDNFTSTPSDGHRIRTTRIPLGPRWITSPTPTTHQSTNHSTSIRILILTWNLWTGRRRKAGGGGRGIASVNKHPRTTRSGSCWLFHRVCWMMEDPWAATV